MPYFRSAYDTTVGKAYDVKKVQGAIALALIKTDFVNTNVSGDLRFPISTDGFQASFVSNNTAEEDSIPMFFHPITVDLRETRKDPNASYVVFDARQFLRQGNGSSEPVMQARVKVPNDFQFHRIRTILAAHWEREDASNLFHATHVAVNVYARWISENITRRYGLQLDDKAKIEIVAAAFYTLLFSQENKVSEEFITTHVARLAKASFSTTSDVVEVLEQVNNMANIEDLCNAIKAVTQNPRLDDLNPGMLVSLITNTFSGTNAKVITPVALEHPPTFIAMVYACFTEKSFKYAQMSSITERFKGKKGEDAFIQGLRAYMQVD